MKSKQLSQLEKQIMDIIWEKQSCSVRDVFNKISQVKPIAYTTVLTVFQRLYEKGFIVKKEDSKAHIYSPRFSKDTYTKRTVQSFFKQYIRSFGDIAIVSFAQSIEDLPEQKKAYLMKLLTQHEKNK